MASTPLEIIFKGRDDGTVSTIGRIQGALGGIATFAAGNLLASGIQSAVSGLWGLASTAVESYGATERLKSSLEELIKQEVKQTQPVDQWAEGLVGASQKAQDMLKWVQKLAITSPFDKAGVANILLGAKAYGFTSDMAQRLTKDIIDYTAATGRGTAEGDSMIRALGQMSNKGKVSAEELNQLTEAGFNANDILKRMGYTLDDVSNGLVPANDFIQMVAKSIEEDFGGAAARQSESWSGIINSLGDLKNLGLEGLFKGTLQAIQPFFNEFVNFFSDDSTLAAIEAWGNEIGARVYLLLNDIIPKVKAWGGQMYSEITAAFESGGWTGVGSLIAGKLMAAWPVIQATLSGWAASFWNWLQEAASSGTGESTLTNLVNTLNAWLVTGWSNISSTLTQWRDRFYDWMVGPGGVIEKTGETMQQFAYSVLAWAQGDGQAALQDLGKSLGTMLVDGFAGALETGQMTAKLIAAFTKSLGEAMPIITASLGEVIGNVAKGAITSIFGEGEWANYYGDLVKEGAPKVLQAQLAPYGLTGLTSGAGDTSANNQNTLAPGTSTPPTTNITIQADMTIDGQQVAVAVTPRVSSQLGQQIRLTNRAGGIQP